MTWKDDKAAADIYLPEIKRILGEFLICEASTEQDQREATDLIVLTCRDLRVACRVRDAEYAMRYGDEFTIRSARPSGTKTELRKIVEGWGDFMFYGFGNRRTRSIERWSILSLDHFRWYFTSSAWKDKKVPGVTKANTDNSSSFRVFSIPEIEQAAPGFLVRSNWHEAQRAA